MTRAEELHAIPVALFPGGARNYLISARLHRGGTAAPELDLGLHGGTYNGSYFCWPQPGPYSMMAAAARRGRATLAIDRLGAGMSARPHSRELTLAAGTYVIHQVAGWARNQGYERINFIGHSLGSMLAVAAAAAHPGDAASLVLTGARHGNLSHVRDAIAAAFTRGITDPLLKDQVFDPGYVTAAGRTRAAAMYWDGPGDVMAYDDDHRDVLSMTEFGEAFDSWLAPPDVNVSAQVTVPVHVITGDHDQLLAAGRDAPRDPQALLRCERPYWPHVPSLQVTTVPGGHCIFLHQSAPRAFDVIHDWLQGISEPAAAGSRAAPAAGWNTAARPGAGQAGRPSA